MDRTWKWALGSAVIITALLEMLPWFRDPAASAVIPGIGLALLTLTAITPGRRRGR